MIAMRLSQKYKHPTIVARLGEDGHIKGSIRGLSNCEMGSFKNYLTSTGLFTYVQGHDNAAGCDIPAQNLARLHEVANKELEQFNFNSSFYEANFQIQALNTQLPELIQDLAQYKDIWSTGNSEPLIYITDLHFTENEIQVMGKNQDTLKIFKEGVAYMKFFAKDLIKEFMEIHGDFKANIIGRANLNEWNGTVTPQIFIDAIELKEDRLTDF